MRRRGRDLYQPHPRGRHSRERAGPLGRVRQSAQRRSPQCDPDRRMPDQPQADPGQKEGGVTSSMTIRPRRSVLYMPGSNARAIEKARSLALDCVILDLEDSVAPDAKEAARMQVSEAVMAGGLGLRQVAVRINAPDPNWWRQALAGTDSARPDAI